MDSTAGDRLALSWDYDSADSKGAAAKDEAHGEAQEPVLDAMAEAPALQPEPQVPEAPPTATLPLNGNLQDAQDAQVPADKADEAPESQTPELAQADSVEGEMVAQKEAPAQNQADAEEGETATQEETPGEQAPKEEPPASNEAAQSTQEKAPESGEATQEEAGQALFPMPTEAEEGKAAHQESRKPTKARSSRSARSTVSIVEDDNEKLGEKLKKIRGGANVSIDDLAQKLNVRRSVIVDLEDGNYEGLCSIYGRNNTYIVYTLKDICRELGVGSTSTDDLVERLYREMRDSGHPLDGPVERDDPQEPRNGPFTIDKNEPVIQKLSKFIVFALILGFAVFLFIAFAMPYIRRSKPVQDKHIDLAPLIVPHRVAPSQIPVP